MTLNKIIGYSIAIFHAAICLFALVTPFITSNLVLLATVFVLDLITIISWPIFDNRCIITIWEGYFLGEKYDSWRKSSVAYYNQILGRWVQQDSLQFWATMRPYFMMFFTGCKMLPILASI